MKIVQLVGFACLLEVAVAQPQRKSTCPSRKAIATGKATGHLPKKRIDGLATHTVWETVQAQDIVEWYDEQGNFISWGYAADPTPAPVPVMDLARPADEATPPLPTDEVEPILDMPFDPELETSESESPVEIGFAPSIEISIDPPVEEPVEEPVEQPAEVQAQAPADAPEDTPQLNATPQGYQAASAQQHDVAHHDTPPHFEEPPPHEPSVMVSPLEGSAQNIPPYNPRSGYGIGWSNYNGDSTCKSREQADEEWGQLGEFDVVRVYGVDCGQPGVAIEMALKYNKKVFVGLYHLDERFEGELQDIISHIDAVGAGWDPVDTISIGNEDVHRGSKTPGEVIAYVQRARTKLRDVGYHGPVVHVDSQNEVLANPELCSEEAGDYIAANVHPFFNDHTTAEQAGDFVEMQIEMLRQCGASKRRRRKDVRVRVAEVGWPKDGHPNGDAIPSKENQIVALASIKSKNFEGVIFFSAYDHKWMQDGPTTFNTEKFWGILDD
jgi:exo-beta-1,3-glucanase (GH17 family)